MTNKEKFRDILEDFALAQVPWGLDESGEPVPTDSNLCITIQSNYERLIWLCKECVEPEVDWSNVSVDTPIYVRDWEYAEWKPQYFARYEDGVVCAWTCGKTSWTTDVFDAWNYAKLAESEE